MDDNADIMGVYPQTPSKIAKLNPAKNAGPQSIQESKPPKAKKAAKKKGVGKDGFCSYLVAVVAGKHLSDEARKEFPIQVRATSKGNAIGDVVTKFGIESHRVVFLVTEL